jgi:hypothetical protein
MYRNLRMLGLLFLNTAYARGNLSICIGSQYSRFTSAQFELSVLNLLFKSDLICSFILIIYLIIDSRGFWNFWKLQFYLPSNFFIAGFTHSPLRGLVRFAKSADYLFGLP